MLPRQIVILIHCLVENCFAIVSCAVVMVLAITLESKINGKTGLVTGVVTVGIVRKHMRRRRGRYMLLGMEPPYQITLGISFAVVYAYMLSILSFVHVRHEGIAAVFLSVGCAFVGPLILAAGMGFLQRQNPSVKQEYTKCPRGELQLSREILLSNRENKKGK